MTGLPFAVMNSESTEDEQPVAEDAEAPVMGPEERLFRSRQTWTVYAWVVLTAVGLVVAVIAIFSTR